MLYNLHHHHLNVILIQQRLLRARVRVKVRARVKVRDRVRNAVVGESMFLNRGKTSLDLVLEC